MAKSGSYLGRVQVLRFFAATAVLIAHLQHEVFLRLPADSGFKPFSAIDGGFGVDLFFVISGFIMYHVSAEKFGQPHAAREFLLRRYIRIAPLYYLATIALLITTASYQGAVSVSKPEIGHVLSSFMFFPSLNPLGQPVPVLKLGWTLNFEAYFYIVFALALAFTRRIGLLVLVLVLTIVVALASTLPQPGVAINFWGQSLVFEFLGGVGIAMLYRRGLRLPRATAWFVIVASLLLLASLRMLGILSDLPRAIYAGLPALMIVTAVVAAPFDERQGRVKKFLVAGGEASYAIYVVHPFGIRAGLLILERLAVPMQPWIYIVLLTGAVIACAFAVNQLIERPLDRWFRRLLAPAQQSPTTSRGHRA